MHGAPFGHNPAPTLAQRFSMTTKAPKPASLYQLPDPPKHPHDKMTAFNHLAANGSAYLLIQHLGKPETTLVGGDHYMSPVPTTDITGLRFPTCSSPSAWTRQRTIRETHTSSPNRGSRRTS